MHTKIRILAIPFWLALGCDNAEPVTDAGANEPPSAIDRADPSEPAPAIEARPSAHERKDEYEHDLRAARPPMPDAKAAFEQVVALVGDEYVDGPLSEDVLWTGAIEGVLARLVQLQGHRINTLLSPQELEELVIGTKGQLVGVGIVIERVADVVVVRDALEGSPAADAGLQAGDRILGIDGDRVSALSLPQIVESIRGEDGTTVELFVQRDTEEWTETITRRPVAVPSVQARALDGGIGYLRITSFAKNTPTELDDALAGLQKDGVHGLVIDLRHCPGGLLETSVAVADRFLPVGSRILTVRDRNGDERHFDAGSEGPFESLPLVVLVDDETASSAEIVADALSHHDRATLVGEPTAGKGTVESIHELGNGWAVKLSVSRFLSPAGEPRHGNGLRPHIVITNPDGHKTRLQDLDPSADPPLAAAIELLVRG